jgi:hypothetical protein
VTLKKYFSHPSLIIYSFATIPLKLKLGQQNRWWTTNSKPLGPINQYDEPIRDTEKQLDHIYYTLFCMCMEMLHHLPVTAKYAIMQSQNQHISSLKFIVQDHILSTLEML